MSPRAIEGPTVQVFFFGAIQLEDRRPDWSSKRLHVLFPQSTLKYLIQQMGVSTVFLDRIAQVYWGGTSHLGNSCFTERRADGKVYRISGSYLLCTFF